jgi:hypothetical protein
MQRHRRRVIGPASARWNDYVGTAATDDANPLGRPSCMRWSASTGSSGPSWRSTSRWYTGQVGVKVHAFNRVAHGVEHASEIEGLGRTLGAIPAETFDIPEAESSE